MGLADATDLNHDDGCVVSANMAHLLLILDLDETLIYSTEKPSNAPPDFCFGHFHVYRRPYLAEFLAFVQENFDLAVWSSATPGYVAGIVSELFANTDALRFVWAADRCTRRFDGETREEYWVKDFKKVKRNGISLSQVLVIDDTPEKHERNYGNLIRVQPFMGDPADDELVRLLPFLRHLASLNDVRIVEKRGWRNFTIPAPTL
jgi:RNA polymerase II subunit A small phosphatase-like protein